jgi:hypothetical protein
VFTNWLTTANTQQFISHIFHFAQPGRESSQIEVQNILDDRLLFGARKLMAISSSEGSVVSSLES